MIKLIIKTFVKNYQKVDDKQVRESYGILAGTLGIICNIFLFFIKVSIGFFMNSIAIISDAFNNLSDTGSSLISILAAKLSNRSPDEEHPFGHGRLEYISSLIVSFIIILVGFELLKTSIDKVRSPEPVVFNLFLLIILLLSILVKVWMYSYNRFIGKAIDSSVIWATARDSLNDVIATSAVIVSTIVGYYFKFSIDGYIGVVVSLLIMYTGYKIAKEVVNILLGTSPSHETVETITSLIMSDHHIIGVHGLKIHDYGPGRCVGSVHVEVLDHMELVEAHSIIDTIEKKLYNELGMDIVIHVDPISNDHEVSNIMDKRIEESHL